MPLTLKGSSSGGVTIDVPATAGNNTLTFPAATGTALVGTTTIANQVFFGGATSGTLSQSSSLIFDATNNRLNINGTGQFDISPLGTGQYPNLGVWNNSSSVVTTFGYFGNDAVGTLTAWVKSRSSTIGTNVAVANGDNLGILVFRGADGTGYRNAASIQTGVDGAVSTGIVPGNFRFLTTDTSGTLAERMRIASDGSVGIGTTTPASILHVNSTAAIVRPYVTATTGYVDWQVSSTGGNFYFGIDNSAGGISGTAYGRHLYSDGAYPLDFFTNATKRMTLDASGRLYVGSSNSTARLNITNGIAGSPGQSNQIVLYDGTPGDPSAIFGFGISSGQLTYNSGGGAHVFYTGGNASPSPKMTLDASGNLGINTSAPSYKLVVGGGTAAASNYAYFSGNVGTGSAPITTFGLLIGSNYSGGNSETNLIWGQGVHSAQYLAIGKTTGSAYTEQMRIDASGNLLTGGKTSATSNSGDIQVSRGIGFPATQVACSDVNTLDDYEEGTWTPGNAGSGQGARARPQEAPD